MTNTSERKALEIGQAVLLTSHTDSKPAKVMHTEGAEMVLVKEPGGTTRWFRCDTDGCWEELTLNPRGGRFSAVKAGLGLQVKKGKAA